MNMIQKLKKVFLDNYRLLIYIACTVGLCWIEIWGSIGNGAQWALAINCTGICVFLMTVCRINVKELLKIPYLIWTVLLVFGSYPAYLHFKPGTDYDTAFAVMIVNVWLYGIIFIYITFNISDIIKRIKTGSDGRKGSSISPFFAIWFLFFVLSIISVNKAFWPVWFLIMLGGFYLFPMDKKGLDELMLGMTDGVLVSFFWIQGRAFLYRPYDVDARYMGHFNNVNVAAMYFLLVYIAWLARLGYARRREKTNKLECVICFVFAGAMWDFALLTLSRSSLLAFVLITLIYLVVEEIITFKKGFKGLLIRGLLLFLVFVTMFLPVYACCRYIPALRHHPVWYGDYSEEKVHSWDPIDSEKYTSLQEFFYAMIGKTVRTVKDVDPDFAAGTDFEKLNDKFTLPDIQIEAEIVSEDPMGMILEYSDGVEPGADRDHPVLEHYTGNYDGQGIMTGRTFIYRYFIKQLNLLGHEEAFPSVWISKYEYYGHTHNSFLQMAYCFGVPAGILFVILMVGGQIMIIVRSLRQKTGLEWRYLFSLLILGVLSINGMFEMTVLLGKVILILSFLSLIVLVRTDRN